MSSTQPRSERTDVSLRKVTAQTLLEMKRLGRSITALTAYDYPTARFADEAGIDLILVGDSVAMTVLGHNDTLSLTMDEMKHHARAARRGVEHALFVVDMPYGSYHVSTQETLRNALSLVKEAGAEAVKIEGGRRRAALVEELTSAEIPVVAHVGLTPQSLLRMGGYRVQGRSLQEIDDLLADVAALEGAGAIAIVLEGLPREVADRLTAALQIPTIGIGAGPGCDGQILVFHDLFHLTFAARPKFVRSFGDAGAVFRDGIEQFRNAVIEQRFPSDAESYHLPAEAAAALDALDHTTSLMS